MENENHDQNQELKETLEDDHKHLESKLPPITAAIIGLVGVFVLYQFGGSVLVISVLGFDFTGDVNAFRLLTIAGQLLFILFPALLLSKMVYEDVGEVIRFRLPVIKEIVIFIIGLLLLNAALQSYLYIQNYLLEKLAAVWPLLEQAKNFLDQFDKNIEESYEKLLVSKSVWESVLVVIAVAVTPAICEETFFRGYVLRTFEMKYTAVKSAFVTACFFGLYHFHPYQIFPLVALGFYFGYTAYKSNSILVPVILHFTNNFIAIIMFFFLGKEDLSNPSSLTASEFQLSLFLFITLTILFILLIVFFNRNHYRYSK